MILKIVLSLRIYPDVGALVKQQLHYRLVASSKAAWSALP
jgi:hypothetical protein